MYVNAVTVYSPMSKAFPNNVFFFVVVIMFTMLISVCEPTYPAIEVAFLSCSKTT